MSTKIVTALAVFLMVYTLVATSQLRANELVSGGGSSESDGFWVSAPNVRFRQGGPGVAFGLIQPPGSPKKYSYLVLIKGIEGKWSGYGGSCKCDGRTASSSLQLEVGGAKLQVVYKMEIDRQNNKVTSETLTVNGKALDLNKGRVLLASPTGKDFTWQQEAAELPKAASAPRTLEEVEALATELVKRLRKESEGVRAFLK
jgi:hypothetical protein